MAQSPTLENTRRDVTKAENESTIARAASLPSLSLSSSLGARGTEPWTQGTYDFKPRPWQPQSETTLTLSETLYNGGLNGMKRVMASKRLELAKMSYEIARDRLVLDLMDKFYKYSLAETLEDVQRTQLNLLKKQFNTISTQYSQGVKTRRDYLRFKAEVRRAEIDLISAVGQVTRAQTEVLKAVGLSDEVAKTVQLQPVPVDLDSIRKPGKNETVALLPVASHRETKALNLERELADDDFQVQKRTNTFELVWSADATYGTRDYWRTGRNFGDDRFGNWGTALLFKFNLWDWGAKQATISSAAESRAQALATVRGKSLELEGQLTALQLELSQGYQNFALGEELLELEIQNSDAISIDFRNGRVNYLDLQKSLADLLSARQRLYSAYFELKTLLARQSYHEATIYEEFAQK